MVDPETLSEGDVIECTREMFGPGNATRLEQREVVSVDADSVIVDPVEGQSMAEDRERFDREMLTQWERTD